MESFEFMPEEEIHVTGDPFIEIWGYGLSWTFIKDAMKTFCIDLINKCTPSLCFLVQVEAQSPEPHGLLESRLAPAWLLRVLNL